MKKQSMLPGASPSASGCLSAGSKLLDVYIRNNKKQALLIHTTPATRIEHLSRLIQTRFRVPPDQQILFQNGAAINQGCPSGEVQLQDRTIIHLIDRRNIQPEITINVRRLNVPRVEQWRIPSAQIIEDFIVRNIREEQPEKMFFVYTGRHLDRTRSFADEFVESESELFCLHQEKDQVKGEKRQKYQQRIKDDKADKKQERKLAHPPSEEIDSSLENYLPKQEKAEQAKSQSKFQQISFKDDRPNFKKKNVTKQINLAASESLPQPSPPNIEGNLSILAQNRSAITNTFFNDGSSISEIVAEESHNPESSKKIQEGSIFQSAIIGLNNQVSISNNNQVASRPQTTVSSNQHESSESDEPISFSFDGRAPELITQIVPDRQLTRFEREILQVTQSQQLSKQNISEQQKGIVQQNDNKQVRQRDGSIQNCQFQLGEIENHQLSASAEMDVIFQQKQSPQRERSSPSKNQILIEDEENMESEVRKKDTGLLPVQENHNQQDSIRCPGAEEEGPHNLDEDINEQGQFQDGMDKQNKQSGGSDAISFKQVDNIEFCQQKQIRATPQFGQQFPEEPVDIYFIEQQNTPRGFIPITTSQVVEEKQQCETNRPSSSNFNSKNSSRLLQNTARPNQYQFGHYFNSATRRSDFREGNINYQSDDHFSETPKSQNSKINRQQKPHHLSAQTNQVRQKDNGNEQDEQSLQIVQLPIDIRARDQSSMLLDFESSLEPKPSTVQASQLNGKPQVKLQFKKEDSKIDQLNQLVSCISDKKIQSPPKVKQQSNQPIDQLQAQTPRQIQKLQSNIVIDTSLNHLYEKPSQQERNSFTPQSYTSLERTQIKQTITSCNSAGNFMDLKQTPNKQLFTPGQFVLRTEPDYFDPLQFYLELVEQQTAYRQHN